MTKTGRQARATASITHGVPLALAFCEEGWELARRTGDEEMEAEIATNYACALLSCGRESEADAIFEQGSRLARKHGMIWHLTFQTINMGERALERNDPFAAEALFLESLALGRQIGEQYCTSAALCGLAQISMGRGDTECALAQAQEAAVISRRIGRTDVSEMAERLVAELTAGV